MGFDIIPKKGKTVYFGEAQWNARWSLVDSFNLASGQTIEAGRFNQGYFVSEEEAIKIGNGILNLPEDKLIKYTKALYEFYDMPIEIITSNNIQFLKDFGKWCKNSGGFYIW